MTRPRSGWSRAETLIDRLAGPREQAAAGQVLTVRVVAAIFGFLAVWRLAILLLSLLWGRIGIANEWIPPELNQMWLWKYSVRWDAGWYIGIVEHGYEYIPGQASSVAFFPGFPFLIAVFDRLLPGSTVLAALVVVHLALAAACLYVYQTLRLDFGEAIAWRTLFFLLIFPSAFFFSAVYTESLLLLGIAGSLYHARRGQWWRAATFGFLTSATKIVGVLIVVPLAFELWRQRNLLRERLWPLIAVALSPMGTAAYFLYLQLKFGDFRVFFHTETAWHRESGSPVFLMGIERLLGSRDALVYYPANITALRSVFLLIDTTLAWVFIGVGVYLWLRVRPSYGALVVGMTLIPALSGSPQSMNRYVVVLFPAFLLLGRISSEPVRQAITIVFSMGLAVTTWLFVQAYWAG